jgi:hypothetical protein
VTDVVGATGLIHDVEIKTIPLADYAAVVQLSGRCSPGPPAACASRSATASTATSGRARRTRKRSPTPSSCCSPRPGTREARGRAAQLLIFNQVRRWLEVFTEVLRAG